MSVVERLNFWAKYPSRLDIYRASGYSIFVEPYDLGISNTPCMDLDNGDWHKYSIRSNSILTIKNPRIGEYKLIVTHGNRDFFITFPTAYIEGISGEKTHSITLKGSGPITKSIFNILFDGTSFYISMKKFGM